MRGLEPPLPCGNWNLKLAKPLLGYVVDARRLRRNSIPKLNLNVTEHNSCIVLPASLHWNSCPHFVPTKRIRSTNSYRELMQVTGLPPLSPH